MSNLKPINFFDFRRLEQNHEVDGLIIADNAMSDFTKKVISLCKFNGINKVAVIDTHSKISSIYWTEKEKIFIPQLEANIIDGCNLSCKGCAHFSNLFSTKEFYPLENFNRDLRRLSECADVVSFYLLGGEPLLLKNFEEYVKNSRRYLPKANLRILTNGLLIPSLPQTTLNALKENGFAIDISGYPQTLKIIDKIKATLEKNNIPYDVRQVTEKFVAFLSLHGGHNPVKSQTTCCNDTCRFLRDGRIYKCPPDALSYRIAEKFAVKNFPKSTYADIYAPNFSSTFEQLDEAVEMCYWCSEQSRNFKWAQQPKPTLSDWLADPNETKLLKG